MSVSHVGLDERGLAAGLIAADPILSVLEASGAPIVAAAGEPLKVIYLNACARAVYGGDAERLAELLFRGEDPGARRIAELVDLARRGGPPQLERLRYEGGDAPQIVSVLCRYLADAGGANCFVIAALGLRPEGLSADAPSPPAPSPTAVEAERVVTTTAALRERLSARHGVGAPRFLWRADANGRFTGVTQTLADVVGEHAADIIGQSVEEVASRFALPDAFARALASRKSWSGIEVDWPIEGGGGQVPVTLGALPLSDSDHRFIGYQGYGVLCLDRARAADETRPFTPMSAPEEADATPAPVATGDVAAPSVAPEPPESERRGSDDRSAAKVVPLRPPPSGPRAEERPEVALTTTEQSAFEEIARALRDGRLALTDERESEQREETPADSDAAPNPASPSMMQAVLDHLPVGVLVARGDETLFANRTLLDYLGYEDRAALQADGGLARVFFGRAPTGADGHAGSVAVQARDGEALDVDAHLQGVEWEGAPATLLTLRRGQARPVRGPEAGALALARELEEKLARARADNSTLRAVLETSGVAIAAVGEDGRIDGATASFAALFGADKGEFDGQSLASLFTPDDGRALSARLSRFRADETDTLRLAARRGATFDVAMRRLSAGGPRSLAVILRAPEAERRNSELEAAREAAEHASAAKSNFLARVSHEIRTPLNAILGFAEVMMEERFGPIGSDRYKEYLKDVHASGAHVLSLVNDLLDLSKIEAGKLDLAFERVDANAVISECVSIMQTQANQSRVVIRLALAPRLPPIRADQRALKQILLNLLSNAVKFNEPGGQVIVSSALTDAGFVVIRVKDTGVGMSDDELATALEPFKQIANSRQSMQKQRGTGLGLPLTKALIEANHASFTIKSRKDEGTLIEVVFPPPQVLAAE